MSDRPASSAASFTRLARSAPVKPAGGGFAGDFTGGFRGGFHRGFRAFLLGSVRSKTGAKKILVYAIAFTRLRSTGFIWGPSCRVPPLTTLLVLRGQRSAPQEERHAADRTACTSQHAQRSVPSAACTARTCGLRRQRVHRHVAVQRQLAPANVHPQDLRAALRAERVRGVGRGGRAGGPQL